MHILSRILVGLLLILGAFLHDGAFADQEIVGTGNVVVKTEASGSILSEKLKEREKTINDINAFLIESYKLKIDKILSDLNASLERATKNDPDAQIQLLKKIQSDIGVKVEIIESKQVSQNRKKILSSIFAYIHESLDKTIEKLATEKAEK